LAVVTKTLASSFGLLLLPQGDPWTKTTLHKFNGKGDGVSPSAGLMLGEDGMLYGTTVETYRQNRFKSGTVFRIVP
jgi:hypothetical protein